MKYIKLCMSNYNSDIKKDRHRKYNRSLIYTTIFYFYLYIFIDTTNLRSPVPLSCIHKVIK